MRSEVPASSRGHGYRDGWNYVNAFRMRGNRIGVYQSRGIDDLSGRGVEIRFRLVQPATTVQPAAIAGPREVVRAGGKMNADRDVLKAGLQQAEGTKCFGPVIEKVVGYGGDAWNGQHTRRITSQGGSGRRGWPGSRRPVAARGGGRELGEECP